jgi:hypothetical protein
MYIHESTFEELVDCVHVSAAEIGGFSGCCAANPEHNWQHRGLKLVLDCASDTQKV